MANAWIQHVRAFAEEHNLSYACALSNPNCKASYQPTPNYGPQLTKLVNIIKVGRTGRQPTPEKVQRARDGFNALKDLVNALPDNDKKRQYLRSLSMIRDRILMLLKQYASVNQE